MPKSEKHAGGRPTAYKPEYVEQAYNYCLLGAIDVQLANFFRVTEKTINTWKKSHPEFADALRRGKTIADAEVAHALYKRATGYAHPEMQVNCYQGEIIKTELTKHYAPDTTACIFWLKNRQPDQWKDKVEVNGSMKLDKDTLAMIETQFVTRMAAAHERQRDVLAARGMEQE